MAAASASTTLTSTVLSPTHHAPPPPRVPEEVCLGIYVTILHPGPVDGSEIRLNSPVEVGSLSHYLQGFIHPFGGAGFLNHQPDVPDRLPVFFLKHVFCEILVWKKPCLQSVTVTTPGWRSLLPSEVSQGSWKISERGRSVTTVGNLHSKD